MTTRRMSLRTGLAAMSLIAAGAAQAAPVHTLHGQVTYRERMMLPPGAQFDVRLEDASLADAPSVTLAQTGYAITGAPPLPYTLTYGALPAHARLALRAEIRLNGQLLFTTDTFHGLDEPNIVLRRVEAAPPAQAPSPVGAWRVVEIDGKALQGASARGPALTIEPGGKVHGHGGCNSMFSQATIDGSAIHFGLAGATQMACSPPVMDNEQRFFSGLERVASWSFADGKLVLSAKDGTRVMVLTSAR